MQGNRRYCMDLPPSLGNITSSTLSALTKDFCKQAFVIKC